MYRSVVRDCCDKLLCISDDFWLIASLTDCSFETAGSWKFKRALRSFSEAGLPERTTERLKKGVDGNLVDLIEQRCPNLGPIDGNRGHWEDSARFQVRTCWNQR